MKYLCFLLWVCVACARRAPAPEAPAPEAPARVTLSVEAMRNVGIEARALREGGFVPRIAVSATLEADAQRMAHVGARVSGRVTAVRVALGDRVAAGDALVEVDTVELHEVTNEYLTAVARARQHRDALERARATHQERVGSTQDLRRAEADDAAARATLEEAEEHLHFLGLRDRDIGRLRASSTHGATRSVVRAPVAGRVARIGVSLGQVVGAEDEIAVVGTTEAAWLRLHVFQSDLGRVRVGAEVTVRMPGINNPEIGSGRVVALSEVLDPSTRTVDARATLQGISLPAGLSVIASVALPPDGHPWLPREAVQPHDGAMVVFVQVAERSFEARTVTLGEEVGGYIPLVNALRESYPVVVRGAFALRGELERAELEEED